MMDPDKCGALVVVCQHCKKPMELPALHMLICEKADAIDALTADNQALRAEMMQMTRDWQKDAEQDCARIVKAEAERDTLRKVIEDAFHTGCETHGDSFSENAGCQACRADKAEAEVERLRGRIEKAYREAHQDVVNYHTNTGMYPGIDEGWHFSDARMGLEKE